mmetsp:Transcript_12111/g.20524  ORF Transcript_12111/g.20524 Transcript_12111/m.20524 type:complete len:239 (+) Transcript_12111:2659-3375(+)
MRFLNSEWKARSYLFFKQILTSIAHNWLEGSHQHGESNYKSNDIKVFIPLHWAWTRTKPVHLLAESPPVPHGPVSSGSKVPLTNHLMKQETVVRVRCQSLGQIGPPQAFSGIPFSSRKSIDPKCGQRSEDTSKNVVPKTIGTRRIHFLIGRIWAHVQFAIVRLNSLRNKCNANGNHRQSNQISDPSPPARFVFLRWTVSIIQKGGGHTNHKVDLPDGTEQIEGQDSSILSNPIRILFW